MKNIIEKLVDLPKLVFRMWLLLWFTLIILLVMKFCFGIWYPIVVKSEAFINICNYIENTTWLSNLIMLIFYIFSITLTYLISCGKPKFNNIYELIIIEALIICSYFLKMFNNNAIGLILEIIFLILIPIIYLLKHLFWIPKYKSVLYPIVINIIIFLWQLSIYLVRDLNVSELSNYPFLIGIIMQLDFYIFILLTYIGGNKMGLWGPWLWSREVTVLKAELSKEKSKENPNKDRISRLEAKIAEIEAGK